MPPESLEYARPVPRKSSRALVAFILGVFSGPLAFGVLVLTRFLPVPYWFRGYLAMTLAVIIFGGTFWFGVGVRFSLPTDASRRQKVLATIGGLAPIVWIVSIISLVMYVMSQI